MMQSFLDTVRVQILASRAAREAHIAETRAKAMVALDQASKEEVILYRQLKCDVEGTHDFAVVDGHQVCQVCSWIHWIEEPK